MGKLKYKQTFLTPLECDSFTPLLNGITHKFSAIIELMESAVDNQIKMHETEHRRLGYAQEFRALIHENPGVLKAALRLTQEAEGGYHPSNVHVGRGELEWNDNEIMFDLIKLDGEPTYRKPFSEWIWGRGVILVPGETIRDDETGLEVTILAKTKRKFRFGLIGEGSVRRIDRSAYFKVQLGDKAFFVKKSIATNNPGYEEFRHSTEAVTALSGIENLGIVQAQLGYEDNHQSWFVSKWQDLESEGFFPLDSWEGNVPNDYGQFPSADDRDKHFVQMPEVLKKGETIKNEIKKRLADKGLEIYDLPSNLFYNPDTGKFFLLDITTTQIGKGIGQPKYLSR